MESKDHNLKEVYEAAQKALILYSKDAPDALEGLDELFKRFNKAYTIYRVKDRNSSRYLATYQFNHTLTHTESAARIWKTYHGVKKFLDDNVWLRNFAHDRSADFFVQALLVCPIREVKFESK